MVELLIKHDVKQSGVYQQIRPRPKCNNECKVSLHQGLYMYGKYGCQDLLLTKKKHYTYAVFIRESIHVLSVQYEVFLITSISYVYNQDLGHNQDFLEGLQNPREKGL